MNKRLPLFFSLLLLAQCLWAQVPVAYYASTKGTSGKELKTAMHKVIKDHTVLSYSSLMDHFKVTDRRPDGKVWDMYSNTTNYSYGGKTMRYSGEGAGYNREHSFPKSWFGGKVSPMYTDIFHIYPTDGYVNNRRWHYPFGENEGEIYATHNKWSKLGLCTTPGYSEEVFEPNDEYKGDFARTYFYMATCYEDKIAGWKTLNGTKDGEKVAMLNQTSYPCFEKWALDMLLRWAAEDSVSQKEIDRNNAVYKIQGNRNPFIDFPGLEKYIWGDKMHQVFDPAQFDGGQGGGEPQPHPNDTVVWAPVFSLPSGIVKSGTEVSISTATPGASIYYQLNGGEWISDYSPTVLTIQEDVAVAAYAQFGERRSTTSQANYTVQKSPVAGSGVYTRITSLNEIESGYRYLIVCESANVALAASKGDIRDVAEVQIDNSAITTDVAAAGLPRALHIEQDQMGYTFYDVEDQTYLGLTKESNNLHSLPQKDSKEAHWTISLMDGEALIRNVQYPNRSIQYNMGHPRFAAYQSGQAAVTIYKETVGESTGVDGLAQDGELLDVYTLDGVLLRNQVPASTATQGLPHGIYLVGRRLVIVK